jgi:DNA-binding XRE family transcriptional regulator
MRVTQYKPAYCDHIIDHCAAGGSISTFGGVVGVTRQTVYNWRKEQPEFDAACEVAILKAAFLDEQKLLQLAHGLLEKGNFGALQYRLGNRLPDEWRTISRTEITGAGGGPVAVKSIERVIVDPANTHS